MSVAAKLPEPEVKEVSWNDLTNAEKYRFTRFDSWPHIMYTVPVTTKEEDNEDH